MHPLVYYAIVEFDRNEMLRDVEMERRRRELHAAQQLERTGQRIGHGLVRPARQGVVARIVATMLGRRSAPTRAIANARSTASPRALGTSPRALGTSPRALGTRVTRSGGTSATIGCNA